MSLQGRGGKKEGPGNESITSYLVVLEALNRVWTLVAIVSSGSLLFFRLQKQREAICLCIFCKYFLDTRNCWYRPASENTLEKNSRSSIWEKLSWNFSLCNLDGSVRVLKLLCGGCKEVKKRKKAKDYLIDFESLFYDCFERSMEMLFVKDARGLSKSTNVVDSILLLCHCYLKLSLIIWSTHFPVSVL